MPLQPTDFEVYRTEQMTRTATVLLPKDYVRMRFTGEATTEVSDAASMLKAI